jgi:hypothetical protein
MAQGLIGLECKRIAMEISLVVTQMSAMPNAPGSSCATRRRRTRSRAIPGRQQHPPHDPVRQNLRLHDQHLWREIDGSAVAHYLRQYCLKNVAGTTSEVYAPVTIGSDNAAGTSIALSANDTNDALRVEVTGITARHGAGSQRRCSRNHLQETKL